MDKRLFVAEENYKRLDVFLSEQTDEVTRSRLKKLIEEGHVSVNGVTVTKAGESVKAGDSVTLVIPEAAEYSVQPENIPIDIVYEDEHIIVVNKPSGMVVHPAPGNPSGTL
ncbi:MAG: RluA family pseudouridine synthase, partial [Clostridia bacterium]|nr:RluA family pseudouridine synthase [Clostridia bacterium]